MWNTIDIERKESFIGKLPRDGGPKSFRLDEKIVPRGATEILIYAWVWIGSGVYPQSNWHYKISVDADNQGHEAACYLYAHTDPNVTHKVNSFAINSDNLWLPMPPDRTLRVERIFIRGQQNVPEAPAIDGPYFDSEIRVIGYRTP